MAKNYFRLTLVILCLLAGGVARAFEVVVIPAAPKGGEAFLVRVTSAPAGDYQIVFKGKEYLPFRQRSGALEIYLPMAIDDAGEQKLLITRLDTAGREEKEVVINAQQRITKLVHLQESDESMRAQEPMVQQQNQGVLDTLKTVSAARLWKKMFRLPLANKISTRFAVHRKGKTYDYFHKGLDFSAPIGTAVRAVNSGRVLLSGRNLNVYGNILIVDHGQGVVSCYFHMSKLLKKKGAHVARGEIIGRVGRSGWATGPHLHMGIYVQGAAVNPLGFIALSKK